MLWASNVEGRVTAVSEDWPSLGLSCVSTEGAAKHDTYLANIHPDDVGAIGSLLNGKQRHLSGRFRMKNGNDGRYMLISFTGRQAYSPHDHNFSGYIGTASVLDGGPKDGSELGTSTPSLSANQLAEVAELVMAARSIAQRGDDQVLSKLFELALNLVSDRLVSSTAG